jgi:hypothetical protein
MGTLREYLTQTTTASCTNWQLVKYVIVKKETGKFLIQAFGVDYVGPCLKKNLGAIQFEVLFLMRELPFYY